MNPRRLVLLVCICVACLALAGCSMSTGSAASGQEPGSGGQSDCETDAVFAKTAELARSIAVLEDESAEARRHDVARLELLQHQAGGLLERARAVEGERPHSVSSVTLVAALEHYAAGLDQLDRGLENRDPESEAEGIASIADGGDLRTDARDQLLDEGRCE